MSNRTKIFAGVLGASGLFYFLGNVCAERARTEPNPYEEVSEITHENNILNKIEYSVFEHNRDYRVENRRKLGLAGAIVIGLGGSLLIKRTNE